MGNVAMTDRAQAALSSLAPADRDRVSASIDRLRIEGAQPSGVPHVYAVRGPEDQAMFVLRATPTLRVLFSVNGDLVVIRDVVNHDIIDRYFRTAG
jgi:hypothetical protein